MSVRNENESQEDFDRRVVNEGGAMSGFGGSHVDPEYHAQQHGEILDKKQGVHGQQREAKKEREHEKYRKNLEEQSGHHGQGKAEGTFQVGQDENEREHQKGATQFSGAEERMPESAGEYSYRQ